MRIRKLFTMLAVCTAMSGGAAAIAGIQCYVATWFGTTQTCAGGCGGMYDICPARVLCAITWPGFHPGIITNGPVKCLSYSGGSGTCGSCVGGFPVNPAAIVIIPNQPCTGTCP